MKPIGGYFSLEINEGQELHAHALRLNAGRYALEYILKARKYRKVYIPYYTFLKLITGSLNPLYSSLLYVQF